MDVSLIQIWVLLMNFSSQQDCSRGNTVLEKSSFHWGYRPSFSNLLSLHRTLSTVIKRLAVLTFQKFDCVTCSYYKNTHTDWNRSAIKSVSKMVLSIRSCKKCLRAAVPKAEEPSQNGGEVGWYKRVNNCAIKVLQPGLWAPSATLERRPGKTGLTHTHT